MGRGGESRRRREEIEEEEEDRVGEHTSADGERQLGGSAGG